MSSVSTPFNVSNHYIQAPKREEEGKFEPGVPEDQEAFRIWVSHCGFEQFQMVWATKPLRAIYQFVQRWLQTDFDITVPIADIEIIHEESEGGDTLIRLPISGVVVDIPLMEEDVLYVQVREDILPTDRRSATHHDAPSTGNRRGPAFGPRRVQGLTRSEPPLEVTGAASCAIYLFGIWNMSLILVMLQLSLMILRRLTIYWELFICVQ